MASSSMEQGGGPPPVMTPAWSDVDLDGESADVTTPPAALYSLTRWQADLQGALRPGRWLPGLRTPHMFEETWRAGSTPSVCLLALVRAAKQLRAGVKCQVKTMSEWSSQARATLHFFTASLSWLDVVDVDFVSVDGSTIITLRSFSSGLLPVSLPLAPLLNACLFFFPFYDFDQNRCWIGALKQVFDLEITLMRQYRPC
ncbi:uncharacterized protein LOC122390251 isoform X1 [Amphibalanus amphitrite]|uniref:uncharacterized protein LOC122390251 isoform X1 n=1 Tax=Amphibalanus amphitrite TaxID=1232801 RepID=UPI001C9200AA|nr:uncharacterized protein LOC122390251 isoform X1 [Amphibalanus amphitrite]